MWSIEQSKDLAREFVQGMGARWSHLVAVGQTTEHLAEVSDLVTEDLISAAWLHDIGYSAELAATGMHAIDGARALQRLEAPGGIVALVAHHTGAKLEAEERGLDGRWLKLPTPDRLALDILNLVDLSISPTGHPVLAADRIAEMLMRYERDHPVHRAVTRSQVELLASSTRARAALGLSDDWPLGVGQSMGNPQSHRGVQL